MRRKKIGVMDIQRSVDITDPCYDRDVWCRMDGVPIKSWQIYLHHMAAQGVL